MAPALAEPPVPPASADARARRWADLRLRALSAGVLGPITLACVWVGGTAFLVLLGVASLGLLIEWVQLWRGAKERAAQGGGEARRLGEGYGDGKGLPLPLWEGVGGWGRLAATGATPFPNPLLPGATPPPNPLPQGEGGNYARPPSPPPTPTCATLGLGLLCILLAVVALAVLRTDPIVGRVNTLFLLLLVWSSDIGAYLSGRALGGPKLAPRISPGKTIAGSVGGLAAAIVAGVAVALAVSHPTSVLHAAIAAALLGMVAQAGDLLESYVKRRFGAKDSGRAIPGHGGLLDRLDALLAAALVAALLALAQGRGVVLWG